MALSKSPDDHPPLSARLAHSGSLSIYNLFPTKPGQPPSANPPSNPRLLTPSLSHHLSLRSALNTTASGLSTGRVTCLSWTSDGYALAVGWELGWSIWSVYGRLGSWSVEGSLASGYGVEGEKSDAFEDHFMHGVRDLVRSDELAGGERWSQLTSASAVLESGQSRAVRALSAAGTPQEEV